MRCESERASNWNRVREFGAADWNYSNLVVEGKDGYLMRRCVSLEGAHFRSASPCFLLHLPPPPPPLPNFRRGFCISVPEAFVRRSPIGFRVEGRSIAVEVCFSSTDCVREHFSSRSYFECVFRALLT